MRKVGYLRVARLQFPSRDQQPSSPASRCSRFAALERVNGALFLSSAAKKFPNFSNQTTTFLEKKPDLSVPIHHPSHIHHICDQTASFFVRRVARAPCTSSSPRAKLSCLDRYTASRKTLKGSRETLFWDVRQSGIHFSRADSRWSHRGRNRLLMVANRSRLRRTPMK